MSPFIKIAWRNISRNKTRSAITISAIAFGLAALLFLKGFTDGADRQMVTNYTDLLIGHIQIHKAGFQKNMAIEKNIIDPAALAAILQKAPEVSAFSLRVKDYALISSSDNSSGVLLLGIDPTFEKRVSSIHRKIREGEFLKNGDDNKIVLGKQLAENLKVGLNDKVVLMSQASDGSIAAAAYKVCGLIEAGGEEIDKNLALITLKAAQDLFALNGKVSEIVLKTTALNDIDTVTKELKNKIGQKNLEVLNWKDISPMTYQWLQFDQVFISLILLVVLLIVASGILNTILMGVLERRREFGIMLALGTKPGQIILTVAAESFFLGLIGILIGSFAGINLLIYFGAKGINLSAVSSALNSFYIGPVIYTQCDYAGVGFYSLIILLTSILVSLLPALKASRLLPIEALRQA